MLSKIGSHPIWGIGGSKVNLITSGVENIICGVPQGSCLGTLLFPLYINDLPWALKCSKVTSLRVLLLCLGNLWSRYLQYF